MADRLGHLRLAQARRGRRRLQAALRAAAAAPTVDPAFSEFRLAMPAEPQQISPGGLGSHLAKRSLKNTARIACIPNNALFTGLFAVGTAINYPPRVGLY